MGKAFNHIAHVLAAERGKEPGGSQWPFYRLSLDLFVSSLVPCAFFQLCLRTQSSEVQLFQKNELPASYLGKKGSFSWLCEMEEEIWLLVLKTLNQLFLWV